MSPPGDGRQVQVPAAAGTRRRAGARAAPGGVRAGGAAVRPRVVAAVAGVVGDGPGEHDAARVDRPAHPPRRAR
eukprot:scaffold3895_cov247-Prasinococcus_capsulatus_cf.AAC.1